MHLEHFSKLANLELPDRRHLEAAEGWLELGDWEEAHIELQKINPDLHAKAEVLALKYHIYAKAKMWNGAFDIARGISQIFPNLCFGFIHAACSLHMMKRTKEAWTFLLPVVDRFPKNYTIRYSLACYACQMGDLKSAMEWLEKAIDLAGKNDIRKMALEDPDLETLWANIGEI